MTLADLDLGALRFRTHRERADLLASACASNPDLASFETIGESLEGDPIPGITLGYGPRRVTLMAGAHADEPVGPETLTTLVAEGLAARGWGASGGGLADLFERFTFRIIPHVNPAAEVANWGWIERHDPADVAGSLSRFLRWRRRERPGMDVEFGYPDLRPENRAATAFLFRTGPVALHASLHGMAFSEGALLLIEKKWLGSDRDAALRTAFERAAGAAGLPLHDHDRRGDKGFRYAGPGFWSTPEGEAMRQHFMDAGDPETAAWFRRSSMEEAMRTTPGESPLCVVTELPMFRISAGGGERQRGVASHAVAFREAMPGLLADASDGVDLQPAVERFGITCPDLATQVRVHLKTLDAALAAIG
ncbi:MAG: M14 family zinc carboxypeptidase [Bacteroidota bacterium]